MVVVKAICHRSTIHMSKLTADLSVVISVGLDLAKHVFQVHCVDASGKVIVANRLTRALKTAAKPL